MGRSGIMRSGNMEINEMAPMMLDSMSVPNQMKNSVKEEVVIQSVRQYFPETWLWSLDVSK